MSPLRPARDALYSILRFVARHVRGFFPALTAVLAAGIVITIGAVIGFAELADEVMEGDTQRVDEAVLEWLQHFRSDTLNSIMLEITALGGGTNVVLLTLMAAVFLWLTRHHWSVYALLLAVVGGKLINSLMKSGFARERPTVIESLTDVSSMSFPSGHAMSAMVVYGTIAFLLSRIEPVKRLRWAIWIFAALIISAIGISRMYLGVHYLSDVVGGYLAGIVWIGFVALSLEAVRYFAYRRPETETEERDL